MNRVPEISVVVPTRQRRELMLRTLAALRAQTIDHERYELIVVCDDCNDGSAEAARALDGTGGLRIGVIEQPRAGCAGARNRGAAEATAPLLMFLDDDMIAAPDLLEAHLRRHATDPDAVVLGAMLVHEESPRSFMTEGLARWAERRNSRLSDHAAGIPVTEMLGGHLSLSRKAFDTLGRFDAEFTAGGRFGGEDLDFGWRASSLGIPVVYEPRAIARQVWDKSFRALCRDIRQAGGSDVRLARKHPELVRSLTLGHTSNLPRWERRAAELTLASPRLASAVFSPALTVLDLAARARARGRRLEHLHAVCRAHLYARGMIDAGFERSANETG